MLTRAAIQKIITDLLNENPLMVHHLNSGENYSAGNFVALMEVFAERLEAAKSPACICNEGFGMNLSCQIHGID